MATGQKRNAPLIRQAGQGLESFKYEVASELNINPEWKSGYWGGVSARECGAVGGHMVRRMIAAAEQSLANQAAAGVQSTFRANLSESSSGAGYAGTGSAGTASGWTNAGLAGTGAAGANQTGANWTGGNWVDANMAGANMTGANWIGANLTGQNWTGSSYGGYTNASNLGAGLGTAAGYAGAAGANADTMAGLSTSINKYNV